MLVLILVYSWLFVESLRQCNITVIFKILYLRTDYNQLINLVKNIFDFLKNIKNNNKI